MPLTVIYCQCSAVFACRLHVGDAFDVGSFTCAAIVLHDHLALFTHYLFTKK